VYAFASYLPRIEIMKNLNLICSMPVVVILLYGCAPSGMIAEDAPGRPKTERVDPVTQTGRQAAVLSVHKRTNFENACKYGMTLTNNLPYKITNIAFRFDAYINGNVFYQHETKNFWELDPTDRQYREMTFTNIKCDQIDYIEVKDPGRCAMGRLTRFSSNPGDCIRYVDVASTPYVRLIR
jgi:hypothetical protein